MNILYCTTVLPGAKRTGGEIATQGFIDALRESGHTVEVLGYQRPGDKRKILVGESLVDQRAIETDASGLQGYLWVLGAIATGRPYSSFKYESARYCSLLTSRLRDGAVDLVVLDHAQIGFLLRLLPPEIPVVFVAHNVEQAIYAEQQATAKGIRRWLLRREAKAISLLETALTRRAQQVWTLTNTDGNHFRAVDSASSVIAFDLPGHVPSAISNVNFSQPKWDVGLIGTWTWGANAKGLQWFMKEVLPLLDKNLKIAVAGKGAEALATERVTLLGFVPDAVDFMRDCAVVAVPSTAGSGVQVKTLDAIAAGRPIVATPIALRGISSPPDSVAMTDDPATFAAVLQAQVAQKNSSLDIEAINWAVTRKRMFAEQVATCIESVREGQ